MRNFRKIWFAIVILMTVLFGCYRFLEIQKSDSSGPVISMASDTIKVSIYDGEDVLLKGITAADKKDGDVTDSLMVENISPFYGDDYRTVTYAAFDSDNHISKAQRKIIYTDYVGPRFALNGSLRFRAGETVNIEKIVTAKDILDGDLTNKVKVNTDASINNRVTGFYQIKYEVTNSAGDTVILPIDVEIYEPVSNEVELVLDRYLVYYEGKEIDFKDFLVCVRKGSLEYSFEGVEGTGKLPSVETTEETEAEDPETQDAETEESGVITTSEKIPKSRVRIGDEALNTSRPGVYPVYYYYTAENGNYISTAQEVLYVVVE